MNRHVRALMDFAKGQRLRGVPLPRSAEEALRELAPMEKPAKAPIASIEHHDEARRAEEAQAEEVSAETWAIVLARTARDHRLRHCCEACHRERPLEPHHLVLRERTDAPHLVMALCAECHRLGPRAAHRQPLRFATSVVIPWADAHRYPLPARKEYRT